MYGVESKNLRKNSTEVGDLNNIFLKAFTFIIKSRRLLSSPFHTHFGQSFCGAARSVRRKSLEIHIYKTPCFLSLSLWVASTVDVVVGRGERKKILAKTEEEEEAKLSLSFEASPEIQFSGFLPERCYNSPNFFPSFKKWRRQLIFLSLCCFCCMSRKNGEGGFFQAGSGEKNGRCSPSSPLRLPVPPTRGISFRNIYLGICHEMAANRSGRRRQSGKSGVGGEVREKI